MPEKIVSMREAISRYVSDGAMVAIEGFTAFICFAAAHEIIRQRKKDLRWDQRSERNRQPGQFEALAYG